MQPNIEITWEVAALLVSLHARLGTLASVDETSRNLMCRIDTAVCREMAKAGARASVEA